jgi:hypothetical protein
MKRRSVVSLIVSICLLLVWIPDCFAGLWVILYPLTETAYGKLAPVNGGGMYVGIPEAATFSFEWQNPINGVRAPEGSGPIIAVPFPPAPFPNPNLTYMWVGVASPPGIGWTVSPRDIMTGLPEPDHFATVLSIGGSGTESGPHIVF